MDEILAIPEVEEPVTSFDNSLSHVEKASAHK